LKLLGAASRLTFAQDRVAHRGLTVDPAVIGWLSRHVGASRLQKSDRSRPPSCQGNDSPLISRANQPGRERIAHLDTTEP
jgi:hypothetical protein